MVLLQPSEYPVTFDLLKSLDLVTVDDEGHHVLPNVQQLITDHFEQTEDNHRYLVRSNYSRIFSLALNFSLCLCFWNSSSRFFHTLLPVCPSMSTSADFS